MPVLTKTGLCPCETWNQIVALIIHDFDNVTKFGAFFAFQLEQAGVSGVHFLVMQALPLRTCINEPYALS